MPEDGKVFSVFVDFCATNVLHGQARQGLRGSKVGTKKIRIYGMHKAPRILCSTPLGMARR